MLWYAKNNVNNGVKRTLALQTMQEVFVGYASENDCEALSQVVAAVVRAIPYYNETAKRDEVEKFSADALRQKIADDPHSVLVARIENAIAGFCLSRFDDYTVWLEWFGVAETYRGRGLAHLLLNKLNETAAPRGCHKIWCDCRTENKAAVHLLSHHGYRQLVTIKNHWYGQDFILWEKLV